METDREKLLRIANEIAEEIKLWDANNRQYHRPKLRLLIDEMCDVLLLLSIGNTPIE